MARHLESSEIFPAGLSGLRARFLTLRGGLRVRVVEHDAAPNPGAPPVLLLSGWGTSAYLWRFNLLPLAAARLRPIAIEMKGQGLSDIPTDPDEYTLDSLAGHVLDVLDALHLERAMLVGLSLGGGIAARVALLAPERVERLALLSAVGLGRVRLVWLLRLLPEALASVMPSMARRPVFALALRLSYGELGRPTARDVDQYFAASRNPEFARSLWSLIHRVDWSVLDPDQLRRLAMPVLAVFGTRDRIVSPHGVGEVVRAMPRGELVLIDGAGHACAEEAPEAVNQALVDFLIA